MPAAAAPERRCAVHPARLAADECPACGRPRCGADKAAYAGTGCGACAEARAAAPAAGRRELLVRASLAALAAAFAGGWVAAQYVDTQYFAVVAPGLVGLVCAWAAAAAARPLDRRTPLVVAGVAGVLGTALSDRLVPGGQNLFLPLGDRVPPYVAAVAGALLWPVLFGPPKPREAADAGQRLGMRRK